MQAEGGERSRPVLDVVDRLSEIIFGLLMALSFTGTMSAAVAGGDKVGAVLVAALGCNLAWGIVDGIMYMVTGAAERARHDSLLNAVHSAAPAEARRIFDDNIPENLRKVISEAEAGILFERLRALPPPVHSRLVNRRDLRAALAIFLLVVASTLPPSLPFFFIDTVHTAMRVSNAVALVMLFLIGAQLGRYMGRRPWPIAFAMAGIGGVLVMVTIALGG
ncbi:VIT1/CCC1 transporter family protein [Phyllobacterium sp.]|uniref:VIT1/CCC1 transporter family protein n=1 Tax=Phyllobacterium sp. TaxID=1871046 RepID=UPI0030F495AD